MAGSKPSEAPDGNGGIYDALQGSGSLDWLESRGAESVHVFSVDNAICKVRHRPFLLLPPSLVAMCPYFQELLWS